MSGQGCITGLRRIMLPTQSGELLSSHQCSDARMRRPTRPFTVEIKSSRGPASIRTPAPALVDPPRAEPLFQDLQLSDTRKVGQDRRPAQEAALSEAHQIFRTLGVSTPGPVQAAGLHAVAQQGLKVEVVAPEQPRAAGRGAEPRQARILPDLLSLSRAGALFSPEAEKCSALHSPKGQERGEPEAAEMSPGLDKAAPADAGHEHDEPAEMETLAPSDTLERAAAEQGSLPTSPSPEVITSSELGSSRQGRHSREVCSGWMYRAACRKAKRRGEPLPQRTGAKWKRR